MILIISTVEDKCTEMVIKWLSYNNQKFVRINETDEVVVKSISIGNITDKIILEVKDVTNDVKSIDIDSINACWYRRGSLKLKWNAYMGNEINGKIAYQINNYLFKEIIKIEEFIYFKLKQKKHLNQYSDILTNKVLNLSIARSCGLCIPETILSSKREVLMDYVGQGNQIINKAISLGYIPLKEDWLSIYGMTHVVSREILAEKSDEFFPSLLQKYVDKFVELRIFYLDGMFFSSAIFSQNDKKTAIDFRNYNFEKLNRVVPFSLPQEVEDKLDKLMNLLDINSGSIDMILTTDNEYVFLEVNPIGQFEQVSVPCNYNLEKKVAEYLSQNEILNQ